MVTIQTADNALKSFYLDAITEALDMKTNPLLSRIQRTTSGVTGKDVRKLVKIGINGGIGAGSETGDLPTATANDYTQFVTTLKNLYGTIEISDKALRASANNEGAFVNLLNDEMQSLLKSASFNFGRMLFGDGSGKVGTIYSIGSGNALTMDTVSGIVEGMLIDFVDPMGELVVQVSGAKVTSVDRNTKTITVNGPTITSALVPLGSGVYIQSSKDYEITGIGALFAENDTLYGVSTKKSIMKPYIAEEVGDISENMIQKAIDTIEENSGGKVNFIVCSRGVRRALIEYYRALGATLPTVDVDGFKALDFHGVPVVTDGFCPEGTMYLLNTEDFKMHQLCDWQWLEGEDGKILKQVPGKPVYTATLVKYAELLCERPCGQGVLRGITEA